MAWSSSTTVSSSMSMIVTPRGVWRTFAGGRRAPGPRKWAVTSSPSGGLSDTLEAGPMGFGGRATDRIDNGIDLVALAERIEGRKGHADLRPEGANDELAPAGRANGGEEIDASQALSDVRSTGDHR
jgi:hypothetical protein